MRDKPTLLTILGVISALMIGILSGCVSSQVVLVGRARPAISPDQVQIYLQAPDTPYEQIANLAASSSGSFSVTAAGKMDVVIARLKKEAANVGANGILLYGIGDQAGGSVGAGISSETTHSPYGLGIGGSALLFEKSGDGVAIYVEPKEGSPPH